MNKEIEQHRLEEFIYELPDKQIAKYPLSDRSKSRLLFNHKGKISHHHFSEVLNLLKEGSLLVTNNSKVIPARLFFNRESGARIEVLLLSPIDGYHSIVEGSGTIQWKCMVGNKKKWKEKEVLTYKGHRLVARWVDRESSIVQFEWEEGISFTEKLESVGKVPLPPYLHREPDDNDRERYQTVYASSEGSVAAPTAGLHLTDSLINKIEEKGMKYSELTLHVGAGTFVPVTHSKVIDHPMHKEYFAIDRKSLEDLIESKTIVSVGTTTLRVLESLYWVGLNLSQGNESDEVGKLQPYQNETEATFQSCLNAILRSMERKHLNVFSGSTEIMIVPGYRFRAVDALITNFHQPGSTLMMLVAAFVGEGWREMYQEAVSKGYRFLSYGDSSLLLK